MSNIENKKKERIKEDVDFITLKIAFKVILILALFLITFSLISGLFVYGQTEDILYEFERDSFYNWTTNDYDETFNIRTNPDGVSEVDRWEFALQSEDTLNPIGLDNPNTWTDVEQATDCVNIFAGGTNDRLIRMYSATDTYYGLEKSNFLSDPFKKYAENCTTVNASFYFLIESIVPISLGNTTLKVYSNDSTLVAFINVFIDGGFTSGNPRRLLQYYDGSNYVNLSVSYDDTGWFKQNSYYDYNIFVNYTDDICTFSYTNATDFQTWQFPLITTGKGGLSEIGFIQTRQSIALRLDNIGVICDGYSVSNEFAWKSIHLPIEWNIESHNIFDWLVWVPPQKSGRGMLNYTDGAYSVGVTTLEDLKAWTFYYNSTPFERKNFYQRFVALINDPYIILYQVNWYYFGLWFDVRGFDPIILDIHGAILTQDSNEYQLEYSWDDGSFGYPEDNYFWVEHNETDLSYSVDFYNSQLEFIKADFNIEDVSTDDRSLDVDLTITAYPNIVWGGGAFYFNFRDATSWGYSFDEDMSIHQIIPQKKWIETLSITISDDDNDWASGTDYRGTISPFVLTYFPGVSVSITTTNLLTMLVPLLVIIIPTLAIRKKFGAKIVMPTFLFMSLICVITGLIPYWTFFIIILAVVMYLVYTRKTKQGEGFFE